MKGLLLLVLILLLSPLLAYAHLNPPKFIPLIPPDNNLEAFNQLEKLCPSTSPDVADCRADKMKPKTWTLTVYEKASKDSKILGKVLVIGSPSEGLKALYVPVKGSPQNFPSDSSNSDWGYSSYFEFTISQTEGDWIQLPKRPFEKPVWININKDWPKKNEEEIYPFPRKLSIDVVYETPTLGDIVILGFSGNSFSYRHENSNDMLCGEEPLEIPPERLKPKTKPIEALYDKDGHLIAWPKYSRGC